MSSFINLQSLEEKEVVPGFNARFVHSRHMTFSYWTVNAGASLPKHSHPHEQVTNMLEGEFEMTIGEETRVIKPGDIGVIPPDVPHTGKAITDCRILDIFYPVREDYKTS